MRVLINAGLSEPRLSRKGVLRLRELGWKPAFHPKDLSKEDRDKFIHGMRLVGEPGCDTPYCISSKFDHHSFLDYRQGERHASLVLQVFDEIGQDMFTAKEEVLEHGGSWPPHKNKTYPGIVEAVEIPDDVEYEVDQYDGGWEFIREKHRTWTATGILQKDEE